MNKVQLFWEGHNKQYCKSSRVASFWPHPPTHLFDDVILEWSLMLLAFTKWWGTLRKFLWPSQESWTLTGSRWHSRGQNMRWKQNIWTDYLNNLFFIWIGNQKSVPKIYRKIIDNFNRWICQCFNHKKIEPNFSFYVIIWLV